MATPIVLVEHPAEHVLFDGALTCDVVLPAHFDTGARVVMQATSEALLKGLAIGPMTSLGRLPSRNSLRV